MPFDFEAIVIGSGFGANVTATELVKKPQFQPVNHQPRVLMLERGVWWFTPERPFPPRFKADFDTAYPPGRAGKHPVQYWPRPDHRRGVLELLYSTWANVPGGDRRDAPGSHPQPLYRFHSFEELDVVSASGVGGGSLIYSNVSIEPHQDPASKKYPVMEGWPLELNEADYGKAAEWMDVNRGKPAHVVTKFPPTPDLGDLTDIPAGKEYAFLGKVRWLKEAATALKAHPAWTAKVDKWEPLKLAVIEYPDPVADPKKATFCERQGRCFLGCLPGARHTLNKTIIGKLLYPGPDSAPLDPVVELRALAEVKNITKLRGGGYTVHYEDLRFDDDDAGRQRTVTARVVVLAAGCLASNELMLNLKKDGWPLSSMVGRKFSTNGDYAGFIDYPRPPGDQLNFNPAPFPIFSTRGPINASHVKIRDGRVFINFEDASIPPMVAPYVRAALDVITNAADRDPFFRMLNAMWRLQTQDVSESPDPRKPGHFMTEAEQLQNTFFFNLMGSDRGEGNFSLNWRNKLKLDFPGGLASDPIYAHLEKTIAAMVSAMNDKYPASKKAEYFRFPFWGRSKLLNNDPTPERKFVTVHPLGGLAMGKNSDDGVVSRTGAVYDTTNPADTAKVHDGFYVTDASLIPGPLAVNPTLTIVAFARKIASAIV